MGHTRDLTIRKILARDPDRFAELFSEGIPAIVHEGLTDLEKVKMTLDDGNKFPLQNNLEVYRAAKEFWDKGASETEAAVQLSGLLMRVSGADPKKKAEIDAARACVAEAKAAGLTTILEKEEAALRKMLQETHRGKIQPMFQVYRMPSCVEHSYIAKFANELPEGAADTTPTTITNGQIAGLFKKFNEDLEITDDKNRPVFSKENPGPKFKDAWTAFCTKAAEKGDKGEKRAKSMSHSDIVKGAKDFQSAGMVLVSQHHAGIEVSGLQDADALLYAAELVSEGDKALWKKVRKRADELHKERVAAEEAKAASESVEAEASVSEDETVNTQG
jgi:hypothetical protein